MQLAAAIPLISGIGNLGGFIGPYVMSLAEAATRAPGAGLYVVAVLVAAGLAVALTFRWVGRPAPEAPAPAVVSVAEEA